VTGPVGTQIRRKLRGLRRMAAATAVLALSVMPLLPAVFIAATAMAQDAQPDAVPDTAAIPFRNDPLAPDMLEPTSPPDSAVPFDAQDDALPSPVGPVLEGRSVEAGERGDAAYAAFQRGLFLTAFMRAADRLEGDPDDAAAMTLIGELYIQGLGLPQDFERAAEWFTLAARLDDPAAHFALGTLRLAEDGIGRDTVAARRHFEAAAAAGHAPASYNLALILLETGGEEGAEEAARLLQHAADSEIPQAQHALGLLYREGRGVAENPARATALFHRAARNGDLEGMVEYATAVFNGIGVAPDEERAAAWFRIAAWRGDAIAQNRLALIHAFGRGVEQDLVEAASWHLLAAGQGLDDERLDEALRDLSDEQLVRAEALARERGWP